MLTHIVAVLPVLHNAFAAKPTAASVAKLGRIRHPAIVLAAAARANASMMWLRESQRAVVLLAATDKIRLMLKRRSRFVP